MGDVVVASTTDTQDEVNQAAGGAPQDAADPELKPPPGGNPQVESEVDPELEPKQAEAPKERPVPRGVEKRIDKLVREKKELEARLVAIEARQALPAAPQPEAAPEVPMQVTQKFDSFDDWSQKQIESGKSANIDEYLEQRDAWKEARRAQEEEKAAVAEAEQEIETGYQQSVDAFKAAHEDWDDVVGAAEISIPVVAGNAIKQLENGPEVVYYLATHPEEAKELGDMPPVLAVAAIGRLSAALEKPSQSETPTNNVTSRAPDRQPVTSKAPPPIKGLSGHAVRSTKDLSDPNMPYDEWRKIRDAEQKARFRR